MAEHLIRGYVVAFNTPVSWLTSTCENLKRIGATPIILDNASTSESLLKWYDECEWDVRRFAINYGHLVLWVSRTIQEVSEPYFVLTDPDLDLSALPDDTLEVFMSGMKMYNAPKIGSALRISNIPDNFLAKDQVLNWESGMWTHLGGPFYSAPTDTTFSLYQTTRFPNHIVCGLRAGGLYEVEHRPWYITSETIDDEIADWLETCNPDISTMSRCLRPVLEEYRERNDKHK